MNMFMMSVNTLSSGELESYFSMDNLRRIGYNLLDWGLGFVGNLILALVIWVVGKKLIKWILKMVVKAMNHQNVDLGVIKFISSLTKFILYAILLLIIVQVLGFQTSSLIAVFGSAALAIGMSLQGSLSNFAGGILLLLFKPFKIGDYIVVGSVEGTVTSIDILYTRLHTIDNKTVIIPNGTLSNSNITNVAAEFERRLDIQIGISYDSDVKKAKELLRGILNRDTSVLKEKDIKVFVKNLDASAVTIETRVWVKTEDYWDTRFRLLETYKEVFDHNGVSIPYNQLDVTIKETGGNQQ